MSTVPDKYFDLCITDPPYGIGEDGRKNHTRGKLAKAKDYRKYSRYDNAIPSPEYFSELRRVSKNQIIWGGNYFTENLKSSMGWIVLGQGKWRE
jgi:site-specific DNA-methyltransferase (adenine-specific)